MFFRFTYRIVAICSITLLDLNASGAPARVCGNNLSASIQYTSLPSDHADALPFRGCTMHIDGDGKLQGRRDTGYLSPPPSQLDVVI